jgi:hypothetical protein
MILGIQNGGGLRPSRETAAQAGESSGLSARQIRVLLVRNLATAGCGPEASIYAWLPYGLVISPVLAAVVNVAGERLRAIGPTNHARSVIVFGEGCDRDGTA